MDIRAEVCNVLLPENDTVRGGVALSLRSATLLTTFGSVSAPQLDFGSALADEDEDQESDEVVVTVTKYTMGVSDMGMQIVRVDEAEQETRIQMLAEVHVKMGMEFLVGHVPKTILVCFV